MSREGERIARRLGGRYRFGRRLGQGGMGEVWEAYDVKLDRAVAIKILSDAISHDAEFAERFRRETKMLARFAHRRIVTIFEADAIPSDGRLYMVMELLHGSTLRAILDDNRAKGEVMDRISAAVYTIQILDALKAAHSQGIIHRDVKPDNSMVAENGHLKLLDFGIAKAPEITGTRLDGGAALRARGHTHKSTLLGTPAYMAPEVIDGRPANPRSDLYAVGIQLYMMLTNEWPYPRGNGDDAAILHAHLSLAPLLRREKNPDCSDALWSIVLRFLEKDPDARFQDAEEADAELYPFVRVTAPPDHGLAETIYDERKERSLRKAVEPRATAPRHSAPPAPARRPHGEACADRPAQTRDVPLVAGATKPLDALAVPRESGVRETLPLGVGFVPHTPCASKPAPVPADVTRPLHGRPEVREPFPIARPASPRRSRPARARPAFPGCPRSSGGRGARG